jgi:hypothetical protein
MAGQLLKQSEVEAVSTITFVLAVLAATILTVNAPASVCTTCLEYPAPGGALLTTGTVVGAFVTIGLAVPVETGFTVGAIVGVGDGDDEVEIVGDSFGVGITSGDSTFLENINEMAKIIIKRADARIGMKISV